MKLDNHNNQNHFFERGNCIAFRIQENIHHLIFQD